MNVYQKAVDALKECVKQSMESDVPSNTQGEIWRHYQGMKTIAEQLGKDNSVQFFLSESEGRDLYDPDYNIQAAQPVGNIDIGLDSGKDVITFS